MFIDEIKVFARAGHGGKGCIAFRREAYRPKGGPDGGNGGRGGDVILEADHDLNNLINQFFVPRLMAQNGEHGFGKGMDGHAGRDLVVKVPCGTMVWRSTLRSETATEDGSPSPQAVATSAEPLAGRRLTGGTPVPPGDEPPEGLSRFRIGTKQRPVIRFHGAARFEEVDLESEAPEAAAPPSEARRGELVADLTENGQRFVLCKGGRGGLGNRNFATAARQTPRFAQPGEPGTEGDFLLELRIMADIGLVGFPNAGKSTLLTAISKARPKVAPYPFTTLTPQIGIVEYPDYRRLTVCDVPGLIEGAHRDIGLGHAFLRHIRRCKAIVILLDMAGTDGRAPWDDYRQLLSELELYDTSMLTRPRFVVANKMDEPVAESNLRKFKRKVPRVKVLPISAAFDQGIEAFRKRIREAVEQSGS